MPGPFKLPFNFGEPQGVLAPYGPGSFSPPLGGPFAPMTSASGLPLHLEYWSRLLRPTSDPAPSDGSSNSAPPLGFVPGMTPAPLGQPDWFSRWPLSLPAFGPASTAPAPSAGSNQAAATDPLDEHHASLDDALWSADVPPKMFAMRDRNGAATLMANEGIDPAPAIEHAVLRDLIQQGHLTQGEFDGIYGPGAFDAVFRGPIRQASLAAPNQGGQTDTPSAAPGNVGRSRYAPADDEADVSFGEDDHVVAPAPGASAAAWRGASASPPQASVLGAPPILSTPPPDQGDDEPSQPTQAQMIEGRETGPSDSQAHASKAPVASPLQVPDVESTGSTWLNDIRNYLRGSADALSRIPQDVAGMAHDVMTDPLQFLHSADPGLAGLGMSIPAGAATAITNGATRIAGAISQAGSAFRPIAAETLAARRARQLLINRTRGANFEREMVPPLDRVLDRLRPQITLRTKNAKFRVDFMGRHRKTGKIICVDCKSSQTARNTANQEVGYRELGQTGGEIAGAGKDPYLGGTELDPTETWIIRPGGRMPWE